MSTERKGREKTRALLIKIQPDTKLGKRKKPRPGHIFTICQTNAFVVVVAIPLNQHPYAVDSFDTHF